MHRALPIAVAALGFLALVSCRDGGASAVANQAAPVSTAKVTIEGADGAHAFTVEIAATADQQERGLMYRTDLGDDGGMLFAPYPPEGGPPRAASFWMKNTPSPLDIIFIRPDHTIARIAENAVPFDQTPIPSGEPVSAILEIKGGRSAALGIAQDDKVSWSGS